MIPDELPPLVSDRRAGRRLPQPHPVTSDEVTVKVLHRFKTNGIPFWSGFEPDDAYAQVLKFTCGFPKCGHVQMLLNIVWEQLNIDRPAADWAVRYRAKRNRSLSVGDVVVIGEQAFSCDRDGWIPVTMTAAQVWFDLGATEQQDAAAALRALEDTLGQTPPRERNSNGHK